MSTKGYSTFFKFFLDVELLSYLRPGFYTLVCYIFINNSRSKQNKKNPEHPFVDIVQCAKFQQKILNFLAVRHSQKFSNFHTNSLFLENNRASPKFRY